jgi:hypothetical protein
MWRFQTTVVYKCRGAPTLVREEQNDSPLHYVTKLFVTELEETRRLYSTREQLKHAIQEKFTQRVLQNLFETLLSIERMYVNRSNFLGKKCMLSEDVHGWPVEEIAAIVQTCL